MAKEAIGAFIRERRAELKMSQPRLEELSGVRRDYISSIELGRIALVYPETANRLRDALEFEGWRLLELMGYETDVNQFRHANPELMSRVSRLRPEQQGSLLGLLKAFES